MLDAIAVETYSIHNIYNYLTPGYFALAVLIGVATAWGSAIARDAEIAALRPAMRGALVALVIALIPLSLFAKNHARVDRSGDYNAYDFAHQTLDHMPKHAVILTDSWTASPLWYAQMVDGERRDVLVSPIFSVPGEDLVAFARKQQQAGRPVYVAEGLRTPLGDLQQAFSVQPVLTNGIERMLVDVLPKPRYRDPLVMSGTLYRLYETPPDATAASVPTSATRDVRFARGVTLAGFEAESAVVERGTLVRLTYYWRAGAPVGIDLSATTIFLDADGRTPSTNGVPDWSQMRTIGQGVTPTSRWIPGVLTKESYFALVPRSTPPGTYDVRMSVFDSSGDPAAAQADAHTLQTVGTITVR